MTTYYSLPNMLLLFGTVSVPRCTLLLHVLSLDYPNTQFHILRLRTVEVETFRQTT